MDIITDDNREEIDQQVAIISVLTDKTEEEVISIPIAEFSALVGQTTFLYREKPTYRGRITDKVKIDGQVYKVTSGIAELTTAQFIDFQTFVKDPRKYFVELLSIFLIPEGKKYNDGYNILDVQNAIRENITAPHARAITDFFLRKLTNSARRILIFLAWKMMLRRKKNRTIITTLEQTRQLLRSVGDGLRLSI